MSGGGGLGYYSPLALALAEYFGAISHVGHFALSPARLHCPTRDLGGRRGRGILSGVPERDVVGGRAEQSGGGTVDVKLRQGTDPVVSGQKQVN